MDKTIELMREYVRVSDMCKGTDVKPWECVKYAGNTGFYNHPNFIKNTESMEFAIAILEGRPVFVGCKLWFKDECKKVTVYGKRDGYIDTNEFGTIGYSGLSWTPPTKKRTFMLNGVELPCPDRADDGHVLMIANGIFYFNEKEDMFKVQHALKKLITEARDKE